MILINFDELLNLVQIRYPRTQISLLVLMEQRTLTGRWMLEELEASFCTLRPESVVVLSKTDFMHDKDAMAELGQHQELIRNRFLHKIQILM